MKPGQYDGVIKEWGLYNEETVFMKFQVMLDAENAVEEMTWFGSLKGLQEGKQKSAREISLETMFKAGWNGDIDEFAKQDPETKKSNGNAFDFVKVSITIEADTYPGREGKFKIKYINRPGEGGGLTGTDSKTTKNLLSGLQADILAAKEKDRIAKLPKPEAPKLATKASVAAAAEKAGGKKTSRLSQA